MAPESLHIVHMENGLMPFKFWHKYFIYPVTHLGSRNSSGRIAIKVDTAWIICTATIDLRWPRNK